MASVTEMRLTIRVSSSAADARSGIVRLHPEALAALGIREWDAVELVGARSCGAVAACADYRSHSLSPGMIGMDEVIAANAGVTTDSSVIVRAANVVSAARVTVIGSRLVTGWVNTEVVRSAILGKVVRAGDNVTLLPRDLGPDFPASSTRRSLSAALGMAWTSELVTVTSTSPDGIVSIQPSTVVEWSDATPSSARSSSEESIQDRPVTAQGHALSPTENDKLSDREGLNLSTQSLKSRDLVGLQDSAKTLETWLAITLDHPKVLRQLGTHSQLGVLVTGPAGVGKATVVRTVAQDRSAVELIGPSVGAMAPDARLERVRAAAQKVKQARGVLFISDVDALLPREPAPVGTLILEQLRSVIASEGCGVIVSAVRASDVDPRLTEPQMCDRHLALPAPDEADRAMLLKKLLARVPTGDINFQQLSQRMPGYVAADIVALVREASLNAAERALATKGNSSEDADTSNSEAAGGTEFSPELRQLDMEAALTVVRPLSRSDNAELALGSVTLDDVGNMVETKAALTEAVLWPLQHPESFDRLGITPPRGVLLYGPPGTGKTFLVRALAATGRLTVHMVKGAELLDRWVGSSEQAVRDLFRRARASSPSLIFFDEIDALAPRRGQSSDSGVGDRVVAALLTELDGAEPLTGVVVLGSTNRPDLIDPALLRPGRLEKLVYVPAPDAHARSAILSTAGSQVPLAQDVDLEAIAEKLDGYSAADCAALLREAALTAMRRDLNSAVVTKSDFMTAIESVRPSLDQDQVKNLQAFADKIES